MSASMQEAAELYEAAAALSLDRIYVSDEDFRTFSFAVGALRTRLGDEVDDSYWQPVLARLVRLRWELATVPLPFHHPAFGLVESAAYLSERLRGCDRVFPSHAASARDITASLLRLARGDHDPLGEAIRALPWTSLDRVLVIRDSRHALVVADSLARSVDARVLYATQLTASRRVYDEAAVIGPSCWFPQQVFTAPRARTIHIVQFSWLSDQPVDASLLAGSKLGVTTGRSTLSAYSGVGHMPTVSSADLLPMTDWGAIAHRTGGSTDRQDDRPDSVEAHLFLLASDQAVYLEADEGSRASVVELGSSKEVHTVATRSIEPGTYLVNRVGGEGDYIPAIADSLLGSEATQLRASQRRWKERLGDLIRTVGMQGVLVGLTRAGSPRASRTNLRRWAAAGSIRTDDYADFAALMNVIGLDTEASELWRRMEIIYQAHLRAGQRVRALLVREILDGDTQQLEERGWQDYDVEEIEGEGSLRVARVEARAPQTIRIGVRQTRQLLPAERDLWHA